MGYSSAQAKDFIKHIAPMIQDQAKANGYIICSVPIAQAIKEGAAGTSRLAKEFHNHHGLKCGKTWLKNHPDRSICLKTMEEYKPGTLTPIKDYFRTYPDDLEGIKGYYEFLRYDRYSPLKTATTPEAYAEILQSSGYATDSSYCRSLINDYVNRYDLRKYDPVSTETPIHIQKRRVLKLVLPFMQGSDVILVQQILQRLGYNIGTSGVDSKYGKKTADAVAKFQADHGLVVDSMVGICTWTMLEKYNQ